MIKEAIGSGETIEAALKNACDELEIDVAEAGDYEVIQQPEKKKLGLFGGKEAKVKVTLVIKESPAKVAGDYLRSVLDALGLTEVTIQTEEFDSGVKYKLNA